MMIDTRFLVIHPRTALWAVQRVDCQRCVHMLPNETAMRCTQQPAVMARGGNPHHVYDYCIDARDPEGVCGPAAQKFQEVDHARA